LLSNKLVFIPPLLLGLLFSGCGYTLQRSYNQFFKEEGIEKVYVEPLGNDTFKPGVEIVVYNALISEIASHGQVKLVLDPTKADAILRGTVTEASFSASDPVSVDTLRPEKTGPDSVTVASFYLASLHCSFFMERMQTQKHDSNVWGAGFSRRKTFPGNTQLGVLGTTSALINESEFDRALSDLATSMMADVHESLMVIF
jgi:hypothetical protein